MILTKDAGLDELTNAMRADYNYGETAVSGNPQDLLLIGWGPRKTPAGPQVPGIPRNFEAPRQGEGWVFLDWKTPATGGAVVSYQIERRLRPVGDWAIVGMAIDSEITLTNQERGKDWEYRVNRVRDFRDDLLPKLISGDISFSGRERALNEDCC